MPIYSYSSTCRTCSSRSALYTLGIGVGLCFAASVATPLALAALTLLRQQRRRREQREQQDDNDSAKGTLIPVLQSTLLTGRVWHTRFHPTRHSFTYPLFMFAVDLDEQDEFNDHLWPLSCIMHLDCTKHHLINGEGRDKDKPEQNTSHNPSQNTSLLQRVFRLVHQRTAGYLTPTADSHRVLLLTHLSYYGYCFNPVAFYYLLRRQTNRLEAVVAEVFNTPWLESYCYVLHPTNNAVDRVKYSRNTTTGATRYQFPKTFHVSPFMEMEYTYDWTFAGQDHVLAVVKSHDDSQDTYDNQHTPPPRLKVTTAMVRQDKETKQPITQFTATLQLTRAGLHPWTLATKLATYPAYCVLVQLWIHVEAFFLFAKGVPYQPHPQNAQTTASRIIGAAMTPLFCIQDVWNEYTDRRRRGAAAAAEEEKKVSKTHA